MYLYRILLILKVPFFIARQAIIKYVNALIIAFIPIRAFISTELCSFNAQNKGLPMWLA